MSHEIRKIFDQIMNTTPAAANKTAAGKPVNAAKKIKSKGSPEMFVHVLTDEDIKNYIKILKESKDEGKIISTIVTIGCEGPYFGPFMKQIIELVTGFLNNKNPGIQSAAIWAMGNMEEYAKNAVGLLISKLNSAAGKNAKEALINIGKHAVPDLLETVKTNKNDYTKAEIIEILGFVDPPAKSALPMITQLLKNKNTNSVIRIRAASSLGYMCPIMLEKNKKSIILIRPAISALVGAMGDKETRDTSIASLSAIGTFALPEIKLALKNKDPKIASGALYLLGLIDPQFQQTVTDIPPKKGEKLPATDK